MPESPASATGTGQLTCRLTRRSNAIRRAATDPQPHPPSAYITFPAQQSECFAGAGVRAEHSQVAVGGPRRYLYAPFGSNNANSRRE